VCFLLQTSAHLPGLIHYEETMMAADPLSAATRTTKRNLLAVSSVIILIKMFDVSLDKLPVSGLVLTYDEGAVMFGLVAATVYFLVAFCMYYWIDIKDNKETDYEVTVREWYKGAADLYRRKRAKVMADRAQLLMPQNHRVNIVHGAIEQAQKRVQNPFQKVLAELIKPPYGHEDPFSIVLRGQHLAKPIHRASGDMAELFDMVETSIISDLKLYRWIYWLKAVQFFSRTAEPAVC
jgi:hypothetical protein